MPFQIRPGWIPEGETDLTATVFQVEAVESCVSVYLVKGEFPIQYAWLKKAGGDHLALTSSSPTPLVGESMRTNRSFPASHLPIHKTFCGWRGARRQRGYFGADSFSFVLFCSFYSSVAIPILAAGMPWGKGEELLLKTEQILHGCLSSLWLQHQLGAGGGEVPQAHSELTMIIFSSLMLFPSPPTPTPELVSLPLANGTLWATQSQVRKHWKKSKGRQLRYSSERETWKIRKCLGHG